MYISFYIDDLSSLGESGKTSSYSRRAPPIPPTLHQLVERAGACSWLVRDSRGGSTRGPWGQFSLRISGCSRVRNKKTKTARITTNLQISIRIWPHVWLVRGTPLACERHAGALQRPLVASSHCGFAVCSRVQQNNRKNNTNHDKHANEQ